MKDNNTSNVTTITAVRSASTCLFARMWRPLVSVISILHCVVIMCFLCVYSSKWKFGDHPHPLGNLCAKFCFFCSLHCRARPCRKIAYSITHLLNQNQWPSLFHARGTATENLQLTKTHCAYHHISCTGWASPHGEKSRTQSLIHWINQWSSLFHAPRTTLENL